MTRLKPVKPASFVIFHIKHNLKQLIFEKEKESKVKVGAAASELIKSNPKQLQLFMSLKFQ